VRWSILLLAIAACSSRPPALHADPQALAYRSRKKIPDAAAKKIAAEAVGDARRRPPWNESLHVHGGDGPIGDGSEKYLFGEVRLFLVEYETEPGKFREVDPADDALAAAADAQFALAELQRWAGEQGVTWDVQLGKLKGGVDASGPDEGARKIMAGLLHRAGPAAAALDAERARLDQKYRDRR
jgi:hypothetical protein